ncbi:MAG TPA: acyl-CoA dehydrogenase family protein [Acidimicrobiales bacterium]|nr:acyl-CoA dehydrogenase family protein [Acidimicrobiales bacterium]
MNFATIQLDDDTASVLADVRRFLDENLTEAVIDEEWRTGAGHHWGFHRALGAKGWIEPTLPPDEGGAGLTPWQAMLLERELQARHAPLITLATTRLVLSTVRSWADESVRAELVPRVLRGETCFCLGYTEPDAGSDLAAVRTRAVRDGEEWVIDGQKMFTTGAQNCSHAFLVTRSNPDAPKHKGITTFLCPLDGVEVQAVHTLGGERTNMVFFDQHRVPDRFRLGPVDQGWTVLSGPLAAEHGMTDRSMVPTESRGGMYGAALAVAYDAAVAWASEPGPDGSRPLDDPVVRRRLARVALDVEVATATPGAMGRIASSELFIRDAEELEDLVGPRALLARGEPDAVAGGWIEYAHRFAQGTAIYGGTTDIHRNLVAEKVLGLPRSTPRG